MLMVTHVLMDLDLTTVELVLDAARRLKLPKFLEDPPVDLSSVSTPANSAPHILQDMVLMKNKLLPQHVLTKSMRNTHTKHLYKLLSYIPRMYIVKLDAMKSSLA